MKRVGFQAIAPLFWGHGEGLSHSRGVGTQFWNWAGEPSTHDKGGVQDQYRIGRKVRTCL